MFLNDDKVMVKQVRARGAALADHTKDDIRKMLQIDFVIDFFQDSPIES